MDNYGTLPGHFMEIQENQAPPAQSEDVLEYLVERIGNFSVSDPTRTWKQLNQFESYLDSATSALLGLPFGLRNLDSIYQESIMGTTYKNQQIPLSGA